MNASKGFTLVELLVVIAIVGILASVGVGSFQGAQMKTRDGQRKSDLGEVKKALRMYYNDNNLYPASLPAWGSQFASGEMIYMKILPSDPKQDQSYSYQQQTGGQDFRLWATLEYKSDGDLAKSQARCSGTWRDDQYVVCAD